LSQTYYLIFVNTGTLASRELFWWGKVQRERTKNVYSYIPQKLNLPNGDVPVQIAAGLRYLVIKALSTNIVTLYYFSVGADLKRAHYFETVKHEEFVFRRINTDTFNISCDDYK
jgi:hypothetical protein